MYMVRTRRSRVKKGGSLCPGSNDNYKLEYRYHSLHTITFDDDDETEIPDKLVKKVSKTEYEISKFVSTLLIDDKRISPKIYEFIECEDSLRTMKGGIKVEPFLEKKGFMVMEKMNGKSFQEMGSEKTKKYMHEIYKIINLLYDNGIVQVDLHPGNIMLTDDERVIFIDFDGTWVQYDEGHKPIPQQKRKTINEVGDLILSGFSDYKTTTDFLPQRHSINSNENKGGRGKKITQKVKKVKVKKVKKSKSKKGKKK